MIVIERGFTNPVSDIAWRQQDPFKLFKYFIRIYHMGKGNRKTKLLTYSLKWLLPQGALYFPSHLGHLITLHYIILFQVWLDRNDTL